MHIQFNGQSISLPQPTFLTLIDILKQHSIENHTPGIAVAVNGQIVSRKNWETIKIKNGDQIEVVHAVQGG